MGAVVVVMRRAAGLLVACAAAAACGSSAASEDGEHSGQRDSTAAEVLAAEASEAPEAAPAEDPRSPSSGPSDEAPAVEVPASDEPHGAAAAPPDAPQQPPAVAPRRRIPSTNAMRAELAVSGDWTHASSGVAFPASVAGFERTGPTQYDVEGNDVSVAYCRGDAGYPLVVSIYVYPRPWPDDSAAAEPVAFEEQVEAERDVVRAGKRNLREGVRSEAEMAVEGTLGGRGIARHASEYFFSFEVGEEEHAAVSWLTLVDWDPWCVKVRVTLPAKDREDALPKVDGLLGELRLPATGIGSERPELEEPPR